MSTSSKKMLLSTKKQKKVAERPGGLRTAMSLTLHTVDAQLLLSGYLKAPKLTFFSRQVSRLWQASHQDDPYADYFLSETYEGLTTLKEKLQTAIHHSEQTLAAYNQRQHLQVRPAASDKPVHSALSFSHQYGYLAAGLIAALDQLLCLTLTIYRVGAVETYTYDTVRQQWLEQITAVLKKPFQWQSMKITRKAIQLDHALANQAKEKMGELPEKFLQQPQRPPFSPYFDKK